MPIYVSTLKGEISKALNGSDVPPMVNLIGLFDQVHLVHQIGGRHAARQHHQVVNFCMQQTYHVSLEYLTPLITINGMQISSVLHAQPPRAVLEWHMA